MVVILVIAYQRKDSLRQKIYNAACSAPAFVGWFGEKDYTQCTLGNLASKPQKLSKADLEKQALDYQVSYIFFFNLKFRLILLPELDSSSGFEFKFKKKISVS